MWKSVRVVAAAVCAASVVFFVTAPSFNLGVLLLAGVSGAIAIR